MTESKGICAFPGCGRPISRRNLCLTHRTQKGRGQQLKPISDLMPRTGTCSFPDCGRSIRSRGLCDWHYKQNRAGQTLRPIQILGPKPRQPCAAPGCDALAKVKGLCMGHYHQQWRKRPFTDITRWESIEDRFWSKVKQGDAPAHAPDLGPCWIWTSILQKSGHAVFGEAAGKSVRAYRWAYQNMVSEIPDGLTLDHLCRRPACVNPYHLDPVPLLVNIARIPRVTHCRHGHEYTPENTYTHGKSRRCKECVRIANKRSSERRRAAKLASS